MIRLRWTLRDMLKSSTDLASRHASESWSRRNSRLLVEASQFMSEPADHPSGSGSCVPIIIETRVKAPAAMVSRPTYRTR